MAKKDVPVWRHSASGVKLTAWTKSEARAQLKRLLKTRRLDPGTRFERVS